MKSVAQILKEIARTADENQLSAPFLVGGAVRDMLLDRHPRDYDITCGNDDSLCLADRFAKDKHVPIRIYKSGAKQLRYDGLDLDFSPHTLYAECGSPLLSELISRDYTVNSMLIDCETGEFVDLLGGYDDLKSNTLRCAMSPSVTFANPANAIRGVKMIASGWNPTQETEHGILTNLHKTKELPGIHGARILNNAIRANSEIVRWLAEKGALSNVPHTQLLIDELKRQRMFHYV